jgi:hypothetical protein
VEQFGGAYAPAATGRRTSLACRPELEPLEQRLVLSSTRPAAVVYNGVMHVYTTGNDGHVYDRYSSDNVNWHWDDHGTAGGGFYGSPAVTIHNGNLHVFLTAFNGHLYDHYWNGSWHMDDHGNGGGYMRGDPSVTTYWVGNTQWMHVFVVGQTREVYDHWWDGGSWHWADRGNPTGGQMGDPAATAYWNGWTTQVHCFVNLGNNLYDLYTNDNGTNWHFDYEGNPGAALSSNPGVATYQGQLHVFIGAWSQLWDYWWDGGNWHWSERGNAGGYISRPAVTTYWNGSATGLLAFVTGGANEDLYAAYTYDNVHWNFDDHGNGGGYQVRDPAVATDAANRLHVFMHATNGDLYDHWWDGYTWYWRDWNKPNTGY